MNRVIVLLTSLLAILLLSILLLVMYHTQQPEAFPQYLKPVVTIENSFEITTSNYEYYLNYSFVLNSRNEAREWLEKHLSSGSRVYLLDLGIYFVNNATRESVRVYTSGCTGFMRVKQAIEGDYFQPRKVCTLPLILRSLEPRGGMLKDGELLFVTASSRVIAIFEAELTAFCRGDECYTIRFELEITTTRDGEFKITIPRVEYVPVKPPV